MEDYIKGHCLLDKNTDFALNVNALYKKLLEICFTLLIRLLSIFRSVTERATDENSDEISRAISDTSDRF